MREKLGIPCLGVVPAYEVPKPGAKMSAKQQRRVDAATEAYRRLRTNLLFAAPDTDLRSGPTQTSAANKNLEPNLGGEYDDYIQVFVPADASLDDIKLTQGGSTASVSAEDIRTEANRAVFAYFLSVPPGTSATIEFDYTSSAAQQGGGYALSWEKQVNALTYPITVDITSPGRSPLHSTSDTSVDRTFSTP